MKTLRIVLLAVLFVTGCAGQNLPLLPPEDEGCRRLKFFFESLPGYPWEEIQKVVFYGEDSNKPLDEQQFDLFKGYALYTAGCCSCETHPLAKDWTIYLRLECMWEYLEKETVQKIAFCWTGEYDRPEDWNCEDITEPDRIKEVLKLLEKALEKGEYKFAYEGGVGACQYYMRITTDKHKIMLPVEFYEGDKTVRGIGWSSYELGQKLDEWWRQTKDPNQPE